MTHHVPDRYLWLGLGLFTFFAVQQVSNGLQHILALTEIHEHAGSRPNQPSQQPSPQAHHPNHQEDAISPSSLCALATCHNSDISGSATRILCTRFYASAAARKALLRDLKSRDEGVKRKAQVSLQMLCELGIWKHDEVMATGRRIGRWRVMGRRERICVEECARAVVDNMRRMRREAVVIHDGEGSVGSENVYMRTGGEDLRNGEVDEGAASNANQGISLDQRAAWIMAAEAIGAPRPS